MSGLRIELVAYPENDSTEILEAKYKELESRIRALESRDGINAHQICENSARHLSGYDA